MLPLSFFHWLHVCVHKKLRRFRAEREIERYTSQPKEVCALFTLCGRTMDAHTRAHEYFMRFAEYSIPRSERVARRWNCSKTKLYFWSDIPVAPLQPATHKRQKRHTYDVARAIKNLYWFICRSTADIFILALKFCVIPMDFPMPDRPLNRLLAVSFLFASLKSVHKFGERWENAERCPRRKQSDNWLPDRIGI